MNHPIDIVLAARQTHDSVQAALNEVQNPDVRALLEAIRDAKTSPTVEVVARSAVFDFEMAHYDEEVEVPVLDVEGASTSAFFRVASRLAETHQDPHERTLYTYMRLLQETRELWDRAPTIQVLQRAAMAKTRVGLWNIEWPWLGEFESVVSMTGDGFPILKAEVLDRTADGPTMFRLLTDDDPVLLKLILEGEHPLFECFKKEGRQTSGHIVPQDHFNYQAAISRLASLTLTLDEFSELIRVL